MCMKLWRACLLAVCLGMVIGPFNAARAAQTAPTLEPAEVEAFFDGLMAAQLESDHIPGATVAVVQNGEVILAQGYGYANLAERTPVAADRTLFRSGSISKLFVWTAVMQQVEAGKLDLNADVNTYLSAFQIPNTYPEPITLAHLMAHTPGFEEIGLGTFVRTADDLPSLEDHLAHNMPKRVRPPGVLSAYSNYGAALAGYIVSQVAGMPFEQYMDEKIFAPLRMTHSTFQQPLPSPLQADLATGYLYRGGKNEPRDFEYIPPAPAGALSTTATDMANFMIAHLQNGRFEDAHILQEETAVTMHEQSFTHDPRVSGFAHGFIESTLNGQRIIGHGGDTIYFHSELMLLPEQNAGLFVSYSGSASPLAVMNTQRAFMDHYFPAPVAPKAAPPANFADQAARVSGSYMAARGNQSTPEKLNALFSALTVQPGADDELVATLGAPAIFTWRYAQQEPLIYTSADTPPSIAGDLVFRTDTQGNVTQLFVQNNPTTAFLRMPWYAAPSFNFTLLGSAFFLFLTVLIGGLIAWRVNWRLRMLRTWGMTMAGWLAGLMSLLSIGFVFVLISIFSNPEIVFGLPPSVESLFLLPWVLALLALGMAICTVLAWRHRYWGWPRRLHYTLTTVAALGFVWFLAFWRLINIPIG
ncbi:MAG: serine hydrolase [Caldilineaceae bacterium]